MVAVTTNTVDGKGLIQRDLGGSARRPPNFSVAKLAPTNTLSILLSATPSFVFRVWPTLSSELHTECKKPGERRRRRRRRNETARRVANSKDPSSIKLFFAPRRVCVPKSKFIEDPKHLWNIFLHLAWSKPQESQNNASTC